MGCLSCQSLACAAIWLSLGLATPVQAASGLFIDLKYDVDPTLSDCMDDSDFRSMVARHVGYDPYRAGAGLGVEVRIRAAEHELQGSIDWSSPAQGRIGERRFVSEGRDCNTMLATMGFALAVQIQLMAMAPTVEPSPEPPTEPPTVGKAAPPDREPLAGGHRSRDITVWGGGGPSAGLGLGPGPVVQGRLFLSLGSGQVASEIGAEATLPSTTRQDYGGGFRHRLVLGTWAGCGLRGATSACALLKLGWMEIQGVGLDRPASPGGFVAATGLRLGHAISLGDHVALAVHVDALYLLTSWTVEVNHVAVWTMPRLGGLAGIDLALRFW